MRHWRRGRSPSISTSPRTSPGTPAGATIEHGGFDFGVLLLSGCGASVKAGPAATTTTAPSSTTSSAVAPAIRSTLAKDFNQCNDAVRSSLGALIPALKAETGPGITDPAAAIRTSDALLRGCSSIIGIGASGVPGASQGVLVQDAVQHLEQDVNQVDTSEVNVSGLTTDIGAYNTAAKAYQTAISG